MRTILQSIFYLSISFNAYSDSELGNGVINLIETHSRESYYETRNALLIELINKVDFNKVNFENDYSLSLRDQEFQENFTGEQYCKSLRDIDINVLFKKEIVIIIEKTFNRRIISGTDCNPDFYSEGINVETFQKPKKEELKNIFLTSIELGQRSFNSEFPNEVDIYSQKTRFSIDQTGYNIEFSDGVFSGYHIGSAKNVHSIFLEDEKRYKTSNSLNLVEMADVVHVNWLTESKTPFAGFWSKKISFNTPKMRNTMLLNEISLKQVLKRFDNK